MIYYTVIKRKNPKDDSVMYYAQSKQQSFLSPDQVAENISHKCTVTIHDIKAVLSALQEEVIMALRDGRGVRLGDLGSFHTTLQSTGAKDPESFKKSNLTNLMVRFVKSSKMRAALSLTNKKVKIVNIGTVAGKLPNLGFNE